MLLQDRYWIHIIKIAGPGYPTEFTISYHLSGDKKPLMSGSKNALGTYKYIGIITDGSPIYSYEFNDEGSFRVTYIFREFRGNENKKIWKWFWRFHFNSHNNLNCFLKSKVIWPKLWYKKFRLG